MAFPRIRRSDLERLSISGNPLPIRDEQIHTDATECVGMSEETPGIDEGACDLASLPIGARKPCSSHDRRVPGGRGVTGGSVL